MSNDDTKLPSSPDNSNPNEQKPNAQQSVTNASPAPASALPTEPLPAFDIKNVESTPVNQIITKNNIDLNENVGKFGNTNIPLEQFKDEELGTAKKDKNVGYQLNFDKFRENKVRKLNEGTWFGRLQIWLDKRLNIRRKLLMTWAIYFGFIIFALIGCILWINFTSGALQNTGYAINLLTNYYNSGQAGVAFAWIALCILILPFIILLTAWVIGINGVYRSLTFHLWFIFFMCLVLLALILSTILCSVYFAEYNAWTIPNMQLPSGE